MNKWTWLVVGAAVLWALISWNWYVCGIKDLCTVQESQTVESDITSEKATLDRESVDERPDDVVRGGEVQSGVTSTTTKVVGERVTVRCEAYLTGSVNIGANNNPQDVRKVEEFLNDVQRENLTVDGVYGAEDIAAVERFQEEYREAILDPLGLTEPTGRVLGSTRDHINRLYCALNARN